MNDGSVEALARGLVLAARPGGSDSQYGRLHRRKRRGVLEALACLRASGLSLDDMRRYLGLQERGDEAAAEQKALFVAHAEEVADEIRQLTIRQRYLSGKVAYWDARLNGDMELAEQIAAQNQEIAKELK